MKFSAKAALIMSKVANSVKEHSPQILMVVGTITSVTAVVEAVKQTPKAIDILEKHKEDAENEKEALALNDPEYGEKEYKANMGKLYIRTGKELGKVYLMPIVIEVTSLACFISAHRIMTVRNKALAGALATSIDAYNSYRNRVIEEVGEETESRIRTGSKIEKITEEVIDENGKKKKVTKKLEVVNPEIMDSPYDILWMPGDPGFDASPELREMYILNTENYYDTILFEKNLVNAVSLNDIRKNFKKSNEVYLEIGQVAGWNKDSDDGQIKLNFCEVSIPDPENPKFFIDAVLISPNISGSIVPTFIK